MRTLILDWLGWERVSETQRRHTEILMKLSELKDALTGIDGRLTEASGEITTLVQQLRDALADATVPPEAEAALSAIQAKASALADIVQ